MFVVWQRDTNLIGASDARVFGWQLAKADWRLKKESARQTPPKWLNYAGEKSE
jgi:hypothetical protein